MALTPPLSADGFVALQREFSGAVPAQRTAAIARLVAYLTHAPAIITQYLDTHDPPRAFDNQLRNTPLPPALQAATEQQARWFPLLRRLYMHHGLYSWDIGKCYLLRWQQEGPSALLLFEVLDCLAYFPVVQDLLVSEFRRTSLPVAQLLQTLLPTLPFKLFAKAMWLFQELGQDAQCCLMTLLEMLDRIYPKRNAEIIQALSLFFEDWPLAIDPEERFVGLRMLLTHPGDRENLRLLKAYLDAWHRVEDCSVALDYVRHHVDPEHHKYLLAEFT